MNRNVEIRTTSGELLRTELFFLVFGFFLGTAFGFLLSILMRRLAAS